MDAIFTFLLGTFGILAYAVYQVWTKIRTDGFSMQKFFIDNKRFWLSGLALHFVISLGTLFVPEMLDIVNHLGFAIENATGSGWVLFGVALGTGTDKTKLSGIKNLNIK